MNPLTSASPRWIALLILAVLFSSCNTVQFGGGGDLPEPMATSVTGPIPGGAEAVPEPAPAPVGAAPDPTLVNHRVNRHTAPPVCTAKAAIVVDARSGNVLYSRNIDTRLPAASTQKLLLGLMMVEGGNLSKSIKIQPSDTWAEPTKMGIKAGEIYRKEDLLRAVLVRSSNDIARALARDQYGSVQAFANAANRRAQQLGMKNSYFTNASGLPTPPGQYSTARDLAILCAAAMRKPFIREAVGTEVMTFRFANGTTKTIYNTNQVLRNFPYCTGAKTGYTNAAGRCLVSTAEKGNRSVIAVVLGSKTPNVWTESQALLSWGIGL